MVNNETDAKEYFASLPCSVCGSPACGILNNTYFCKEHIKKKKKKPGIKNHIKFICSKKQIDNPKLN